MDREVAELLDILISHGAYLEGLKGLGIVFSPGDATKLKAKIVAVKRLAGDDEPFWEDIAGPDDRNLLKRMLLQCTAKQRGLFARMYVSVEEMSEQKIPWAIQQVRRTLEINEQTEPRIIQEDE